MRYYDAVAHPSETCLLPVLLKRSGDPRFVMSRNPLFSTRLLSKSHDDLKEAGDILRRGGLVAFGTETVYGLGALSSNAEAVRRLYQAKGRPANNPLIHHFHESQAAFAHVAWETDSQKALASALAQKYWPGPLTLVLPLKNSAAFCPASLAALTSFACRVPRGRHLTRLLKLAGGPVAAPSANRSGGVSPSTSAHVLADLDGRIEAVVECGPAEIGLESTIVDLTSQPPIILREGGIPAEELAEYGILPPARFQTEQPAAPKAPGQLTSHYAPDLPLRINAIQPEAGEIFIGFGPECGPERNLSPAGDLWEAARNLYRILREADQEGQRTGHTALAVHPVPHESIGAAINERLARAAAQR